MANEGKSDANPEPDAAPAAEPSADGSAPRDEAIALLRAGKDADAIWDALLARGLDEADAVLALQSAYRALGREDEVAEMSTVELLSRSQPDLPVVKDRPPPDAAPQREPAGDAPAPWAREVGLAALLSLSVLLAFPGAALGPLLVSVVALGVAGFELQQGPADRARVLLGLGLAGVALAVVLVALGLGVVSLPF